MFDPVGVLTGKPHRMTMGLRRLPDQEWLVPDPDGSILAAKRRILAEHRDQVLFLLPEAQEAAAELLEVLAEAVGEPSAARAREAAGMDDPLTVASLLVAEDLCILTRSETWRLTAASVCFPSRWDLRGKINATVAQIHGPVPGYERISDPTDKFFERLSPDDLWWRTNWTAVDDPEWFQPGPAGSGKVDADWTFRVERQTLRLLPKTGAALFTIRTFTTRVADLNDGDREQLLASMEHTGLAMAQYRGWPEGLAEQLRG